MKFQKSFFYFRKMRSGRMKRDQGNEGEQYIFLRKMRSNQNSPNDNLLHYVSTEIILIAKGIHILVKKVV